MYITIKNWIKNVFYYKKVKYIQLTQSDKLPKSILNLEKNIEKNQNYVYDYLLSK